ncbi:hypothetical protein VZ17_004756 [Salmonella enterica subsp. enterica serovar Abaetetuba]|nr:hypothetical protein [Salmonella enterica subsp. enterica serovar Abaetetuba]
MSFKTGFITPPWPHTRGDSVSALSLINRVEKNAASGSGLYYEIYHYRALEELYGILANLCAADAATFQKIAASRGFSLNESNLQDAFQAYHEIISEIKREQL